MRESERGSEDVFNARRREVKQQIDDAFAESTEEVVQSDQCSESNRTTRNEGMIPKQSGWWLLFTLARLSITVLSAL
jgi:hypothetical protein